MSITDGWLRTQLEAVLTGRPEIGSRLSECRIDLARLSRLRIAIGEPLRIAAELDGAVDVKALTCVVGDSVIAQLASLGVAVRDRPGGIAVDYHVEHAAPRDAATIAGRCATENCGLLHRGQPQQRERQPVQRTHADEPIARPRGRDLVGLA